MNRAGKGNGHHHRNRKQRPALEGDRRGQRAQRRARDEARDAFRDLPPAACDVLADFVLFDAEQRGLNRAGGAPRLVFPGDVIAVAMLDGPLPAAAARPGES